MTLAELKSALAALNQPAFRAKQVYHWLHRGVRSFEEMTDLSKALRERLAQNYLLTAPQVVRRQESALDGTVKYLWQLHDGNCVETVLMRYHHGNTVCISSEVGCPMGCAFCASTIGGLVRKLSAGEMLDEVLFTELDSGQEISNIVLMGIGEPLDNYDNVIRFLHLLTDPKGYGLSARSITLSTCGLVPRIHQLAEEGLPITLAISLHAPDDETRRQIMPIARRYHIAEVLEAAEAYFKLTGRRITCEYSLIDGVNDSEDHAYSLARLLKGRGFHVNLISVNPIKERSFRESTESSVSAFKKILEKYRINVTIRKKLGADIDSACGQLRLEFSDSKET